MSTDIAWIMDVLRANRMHEADCAYKRSLVSQAGRSTVSVCDCWLSRPPGSERSTWTSRDLTELVGGPEHGVRVDEFSNIAGASRRMTWPDGRVRRFDRDRGDKGWTEVFSG